MKHIPAPFLIGVSSNLAETPEIMNTEYLDQLAHQLRIDKTPACRRAVNRMLAEMKKRCEAGEYSNQTEAKSAFRKLVEHQRGCQNRPTDVRKVD